MTRSVSIGGRPKPPPSPRILVHEHDSFIADERDELRQDLDRLLAAIREHKALREQHPKGPSKRNAKLWELAQEIEDSRKETKD